MRDAHVVIVDDDGQHIGGRAVRAQQDHVVELLVREFHIALHDVVNDRLARLLGLQAHDKGRVLGRVRQDRGRASGRRSERLAFGALLGAHLVELLRVA